MRGLTPSILFTEPAAAPAPPAAPAQPDNQAQTPTQDVDDVILDEEGQPLRSEDDTMIRAE